MIILIACSTSIVHASFFEVFAYNCPVLKSHTSEATSSHGKGYSAHYSAVFLDDIEYTTLYDTLVIEYGLKYNVVDNTFYHSQSFVDSLYEVEIRLTRQDVSKKVNVTYFNHYTFYEMDDGVIQRRSKLIEQDRPRVEQLAEQQRLKLEEERLSRIDGKLHVTCYRLDMDSCGGTSFGVSFFNGFKKPIKYIHFNASFYNSVDDRVYSQFSHQDYTTYCETGYIQPGDYGGGTWNGIYNTTAKYFKLNNIKVTFKDKTVIYVTKGKNLVISYK